MNDGKLHILPMQFCTFPLLSTVSLFLMRSLSQPSPFTTLFPISLSLSTLNSTTDLKLLLETISFLAPSWDALILTIDSTALEAKGKPEGGEWERGADLHSFAVHPEGTRLVPAVTSWHYHTNSSLKSFTEDHYLVSKWKLSSCIKETYWLKQHTRVCSCLKSDASGERNKCSSIITVHACIDEKEDIAELKTNQQNNKTNHKTQQKT